MSVSKNKTVTYLTICMIVLTIISAGVGMFSSSSGSPFHVISRYGERVRMYGQGIYTYDSYFKAPIFRGTDFTFLFIVIPLMSVILFLDLRRASMKLRVLQLSGTGCVLYYAASYVLGTSYNKLFLVYIALFSVSLFGFIIGIMELTQSDNFLKKEDALPYKSITIFLILSCIALFAAWLPDIITGLITNKPITLIEIYTTEITYVLDMGIVSPGLFITMVLVIRRKQLGFILLSVFLVLCTVVGVSVCFQTLFQMQAGITVPVGEMITKVFTFILLALLAGILEFKLIKAVS